MKIFEMPNIVVVNFSAEDILTTSVEQEETPDLGGRFGTSCI